MHMEHESENTVRKAKVMEVLLPLRAEGGGDLTRCPASTLSRLPLWIYHWKFAGKGI